MEQEMDPLTHKTLYLGSWIMFKIPFELEILERLKLAHTTDGVCHVYYNFSPGFRCQTTLILES